MRYTPQHIASVAAAMSSDAGMRALICSDGKPEAIDVSLIIIRYIGPCIHKITIVILPTDGSSGSFSVAMARKANPAVPTTAQTTHIIPEVMRSTDSTTLSAISIAAAPSFVGVFSFCAFCVKPKAAESSPRANNPRNPSILSAPHGSDGIGTSTYTRQAAPLCRLRDL